MRFSVDDIGAELQRLGAVLMVAASAEGFAVSISGMAAHVGYGRSTVLSAALHAAVTDLGEKLRPLDALACDNTPHVHTTEDP